jgi:hypothetical protein
MEVKLQFSLSNQSPIHESIDRIGHNSLSLSLSLLLSLSPSDREAHGPSMPRQEADIHEGIPPEKLPWIPGDDGATCVTSNVNGIVTVRAPVLGRSPAKPARISAKNEQSGNEEAVAPVDVASLILMVM